MIFLPIGAQLLGRLRIKVTLEVIIEIKIAPFSALFF